MFWKYFVLYRTSLRPRDISLVNRYGLPITDQPMTWSVANCTCRNLSKDFEK
jgi:hypothetical protein